MEKKITLQGVLTEGLNIGIKNVVPLILAYLLWMVTIWIPYINVGTSIAIATIPIELSKGKVINPTFIFDAKYRQFMGEYFILIGMMGIAIFIASWFFFVPAIVIGIAWSLAVYILLDKKISPMEAIMLSNKATYGYKITICLINIIIGVSTFIACIILGMIPFLGVILGLACAILAAAISSSCTAVIYRDLIG